MRYPKETDQDVEETKQEEQDDSTSTNPRAVPLRQPGGQREAKKGL